MKINQVKRRNILCGMAAILWLGALGFPPASFSETLKPTIEEIRGWLRSDDYSEQFRAFRIIWEMGPDAREVVPDLVEFVNKRKGTEDIKHDSVQWAIKSLGGIGPDAFSAAPILIGVLEMPKDSFLHLERLQVYAADALGKIAPGDPKAVKALIGFLTHPNEYAAIHASDALGGMGKGASEAVPQLRSKLKSAKEGPMRASAARALGNIGEETSEAALTAAMQNDDDERVRFEAAVSLGKIGKGAEALMEMQYEEENDVVRGAAARGLAWVGRKDPSLIPKFFDDLIYNLQKDGSPIVRKSIVYALSTLGPEYGVVPHLIESLEDDDGGVRETAAAALGRIQTDALEGVVSRLESDRPEVRAAAIWALREIGLNNPETLPGIIKICMKASEDADDSVRIEAIESLGAFGDQARTAVEYLESNYDDGNPLIGVHSAFSVLRIEPDDQEAQDRLAEELKSQDHEARRMAALFLLKSEKNEKEAIEVLEAQMKEVKAPFRRETVRTIASLKIISPPVLQFLEAVSREDIASVSEAARDALEELNAMEKPSLLP